MPHNLEAIIKRRPVNGPHRMHEHPGSGLRALSMRLWKRT